jgi:uncharacterized protein (DUF1684 family)
MVFSFFIGQQFANAQIDTTAQLTKIKEHREKENKEFRTPDESPLKEKDLKSFVELPFFAPNMAFCFEATFTRTSNEAPFYMETTTSRMPEYVKYGTLTFNYQGTSYTLSLYQSSSLIKKPGYEDYLFIPFTDLSNDEETYGGGRYLDFRIPKGDKVILDFNLCYNPYCAYNEKYSCPIPPKENFLNFSVNAGVKKPEGK